MPSCCTANTKLKKSLYILVVLMSCMHLHSHEILTHNNSTSMFTNIILQTLQRGKNWQNESTAGADASVKA